MDFNTDPHSVESPAYDSNSHRLRYPTLNPTQCSAEKLVEEASWREKHGGVLQRLDRLTQDEVRITAAQTLEVVYGLVQNMRVVMDGEQLR